MRRKPITLDEIRTDGLHWATIPADSVAINEDGDLVGIESVWRPLIRSLNRKRNRAFERAKDRYAWLTSEGAGVQVGIKPPKKLPSLSLPVVRPEWRAKTCRRCEKLFYNHAHFRQVGVWCSDRCFEADRADRIKANAEASIKARTKTRAAARVGLKCQTCGTKLEAKRSTAKFCSVRCRVTAHRADD